MSTTSTKFLFQLADPIDVFDNDKYLKGNFQIIEGQVYSKTEIDAQIVKGNNSNGYFVKYPDGSMVCYQLVTIASSGVDFYSRDLTFPATFTGDVAVSWGAYNNYNGASANGCAKGYCFANGQTWRVGVQFGTTIPTSNNIYLSVIANGRWK